MQGTPATLYENACKTNNQKETPLQLNIIVQKSNFLTRLEGRHANVRTSIATERISQAAVATRTNFSLDSEVNLGKIIGFEL